MLKRIAQKQPAPSTMWQDGDDVAICFTVRPGAKETAIIKEHDHSLRVTIHAAPEKGKANEALLRFVASIFNVPLSAVTLRQGHASRKKVVSICDFSLSDAQAIISPLLRKD
jgi:uncharacterized protein